MQEKFPGLRGKSEAELRASPRLAALSVKVLSNLNAIIIARHHPAVVQELLNDLRRDHTTRHVSQADHMVNNRSTS